MHSKNVPRFHTVSSSGQSHTSLKTPLTRAELRAFNWDIYPLRTLAFTSPVLQVSFISLQRSFTDEALLPSAAPIVAQSLPCFILSLKRNVLMSTTASYETTQISMSSNNNRIKPQFTGLKTDWGVTLMRQCWYFLSSLLILLCIPRSLSDQLSPRTLT